MPTPTRWFAALLVLITLLTALLAGSVLEQGLRAAV
jgi:hypothetical protein